MISYKSYLIKNLLFFLVLHAGNANSNTFPIEFTDDFNRQIIIKKKVSKVVSIVPSITPLIFKLKAGDSVIGLTYQDTWPPEATQKKIIGGFFSPSLDLIIKLEPEIIFVSNIHSKIIDFYKTSKKCQLVMLKTNSLLEIYSHISLLGKIFQKQTNAKQIIKEMKKDFKSLSKKLSFIPISKRKRIIRLMGRDKIMTPGDDSFQNEFIKLAGGIPPQLNKNGSVVEVSLDEWKRFNPQVIYGCEDNRNTANKFFSMSGWKDVEAVMKNNIFYFPCELTCRASTSAPYFVSWLAGQTYSEFFAKTENQIFENHVFKTINIKIGLEYVKNATIVHSYIFDYVAKSLIIDFKTPQAIVSTLDGAKSNIDSIGNHFFSPPTWSIGHNWSLNDFKNVIFKLLKKSPEKTSIMLTGADMDKFSVKSKRYKEMEVFVIATAGVQSNAVRMSQDIGSYYEPGTINIIILSNMKLSQRAMTRSIISATEAKTALLWDLDIRSTYTPQKNPATGTGTDNIIVVQGVGTEIKNSGGHTKMGELIARAVYEAVKEAIYKQNGLTENRNIFQRLKTRKINFFELLSSCDSTATQQELLNNLENILLNRRYSSFLEASFAISDQYERGLIKDLSLFTLWCEKISQEIAGKKIKDKKNFIKTDDMPVVIKKALNCIINGIISAISN